jgi:hypothetical protein
LDETTHDASESLEERVARLSIHIGARAAGASNEGDREKVLVMARGEIVKDLVEQNYPVHDAAIIADDIIGAARKLASELDAHVRSHR